MIVEGGGGGGGMLASIERSLRGLTGFAKGELEIKYRGWVCSEGMQ